MSFVFLDTPSPKSSENTKLVRGEYRSYLQYKKDAPLFGKRIKKEYLKHAKEELAHFKKFTGIDISDITVQKRKTPEESLVLTLMDELKAIDAYSKVKGKFESFIPTEEEHRDDLFGFLVNDVKETAFAKVKFGARCKKILVGKIIDLLDKAFETDTLSRNQMYADKEVVKNPRLKLALQTMENIYNNDYLDDILEFSGNKVYYDIHPATPRKNDKEIRKETLVSLKCLLECYKKIFALIKDTEATVYKVFLYLIFTTEKLIEMFTCA